MNILNASQRPRAEKANPSQGFDDCFAENRNQPMLDYVPLAVATSRLETGSVPLAVEPSNHMHKGQAQLNLVKLVMRPVVMEMISKHQGSATSWIQKSPNQKR